jgi:hypothetical protein
MDENGWSAHIYWRQLQNKVANYTQRMQVCRLARATYTYFLLKWNALLATLHDDPSPVMLTYMSDGWSAFIWQVKVMRSGNKTIQTWERERQEFVLERGILKVEKGDRIEAAMLFGAPRPLLHGKTAWNMFTSFVDFSAPLRTFTTGACVLFAVFDGLQKEPLKRMLKARRILYYEYIRIQAADSTAASDQSNAIDLAMLTDFIIVMHCIMHVFNLCLKWGVYLHVSPDILENLHIAVRSCNQSTWAINDQLQLFINSRVVPLVEFPDHATLEGRAATWRLIVRDPDLLDLLAESSLWWDPILQLLYVDSHFFNRRDFSDRLEGMLKRLLVFHDFADTRFAGSRTCTCSWFSALFVGLDHMVALVKLDPRHGMEFLHGHSKGADPAVRYFAAVLCVASLLTDGAQLTLLEDDRFLRNNARVHADMWDEVDYAWNLQSYVWESLIAHVGGPYTAPQLRRDSLLACFRIQAKADLDVFRQLRRYPLRLTQGDICANVEALREHADPHISEPVALQFRDALDAGWSPLVAQRTLNLILDGSCTDTLVEQGHGVSALNLDAHQFGSTFSLQCRSLIHQSRGAFTSSPDTKAKNKIDDQIDALYQQRCKRYRGREHIAAGDIARNCTGVAEKAARFSLARSGISSRNAKYEALSSSEKLALELEAGREKTRRQNAIDEDLECLREKRALLDERLAQENDRCCGVRNQVSSFTLADGEEDLFNAQYKEIKDSYTVEALSTQFAGSPKAPPLPLQRMLEGAMTYENDNGPLPEWIAKMCIQRDTFANVLLFSSNDGDVPDTCFMAAMLIQKPYTVIWQRVERMIQTQTIVYRSGLSAVSLQKRPQLPQFRLTRDFLVNTEVEFDSVNNIWVLDDFELMEESMVIRIVCGDAVPFGAFSPAISATTKAGKIAGRRLPRKMEEALIDEFPWLTAEDLGMLSSSVNHGGRRVVRPVAGEKGGEPLESKSDLEEEVTGEGAIMPAGGDAISVTGLVDELIALRSVWRHDEDQQHFFYVHQRGGKWLMEHKGEGSDSATCFARREAKAFCAAFKWPAQKGFTFKKFGGSDNANVLAREVARLGHWYCCTWHAKGCQADYRFLVDDKAPDDSDFIDWALTLPIECESFGAVTSIRAMFPA